MTQADSVLSTPRTDSPAQSTLRSLLKLEGPLRNCKGFASALDCMALSIAEQDTAFSHGIYTIAEALLDELAGIKEEWESIVEELQAERHQ